MARPAAVLLLLACAQPPQPAARRSAIVGGELDTRDPAVVALIGSDLCTGTLISPLVVVTAAHCVGPDSPQAVFFGSDVRLEGRTIEVADRALHPRWSPDSLEYDIALLLLTERAEATPVELNDAELDGGFLGDPTRLVGFGDTGPGNEQRGVKRQATSTVTEIDDLVFFYGGTAVQTCYGDSGGPAFLQVGGREVLAGVTSYGDAACAVFGAATRIDAVLNEFIRPFLEEHPDCGADGVCRFECAADPDCGQEGQLPTGQPCREHADCWSDLCIGAVDDPAYRYCSEPCFAGGRDGCDVVNGVAMRCTPTEDPQLWVCAWPAPTPGSACAEASDGDGGPCAPAGQRLGCAIASRASGTRGLALGLAWVCYILSRRRWRSGASAS